VALHQHDYHHCVKHQSSQNSSYSWFDVMGIFFKIMVESNNNGQSDQKSGEAPSW
jgi:hypothetical protein